MQRRAYIHVGLPKTGTTYLQQALWGNRRVLADSGVMVPGEGRLSQRHAAYDLLGRRIGGDDQDRIPGSWQRLVDAIAASSGGSVIISEELLVHARRRHVRRILKDLDEFEVHVVVTVRDLGRALGSMWQEQVSKGATWPWPEYLAAVRSPGSGPATAGVGFWLRYDLRRVLGSWETAVPRPRIHVVVVPPDGSSPMTLLSLFLAAVDVRDSAVSAPRRGTNRAVGVVETEVVRRLNELLVGRLNERQRVRVFNTAIKPALRAHGGETRLAVPVEFHDWLEQASRDLVHVLTDSDYDVVGDARHLEVRELDNRGVDPTNIEAEAVAAAAIAALGGVTASYADSIRPARSRQSMEPVDTGTRIASAGRALGFRARKSALELADRSGLFARAAQAYLRRLAPSNSDTSDRATRGHGTPVVVSEEPTAGPPAPDDGHDAAGTSFDGDRAH